MDISAYIKEIGRGKNSARPLSEEQAQALFAAILTRQASDLQIGAFWLAMRIKGETSAELTGFVRAAEQQGLQLLSTQPTVILPSYNGARKLPNLTPLLAGLLAQRGIPVLIHGIRQDQARVTSAEIFQALKWPLSFNSTDMAATWASRLPALMPIDVLNPPLANLLDMRWDIGLRGPPHSVVKLINPFTVKRALRVVNYTHPEYAQSNADYLQHSAADALLLRGTEGEPFANPRRQPKLDIYIQGQWQANISLPVQEGSLMALPTLPARDANSTAEWTLAILQGQQPPPMPILNQVKCIEQAWQQLCD